MHKWIQHRFGGVVVFYVMFLGIAFATRVALMIRSASFVDGNPMTLLGVFGCGFVFDLVAASYWAMPLVLYLLVLPTRCLDGRLHRWASCLFFIVAIYALLFGAAAEWFFWDEFHARFNFIAIDYLIYTKEIIGNIREAYPMPLIFGGLAFASAIGFTGLWNTGVLQSWFSAEAGKRKLLPVTVLFGLPCLFTLSLSNRMVPSFGNAYHQELARNGLYSLFAAFWENELSFTQFYSTLPQKEAFTRLRRLLQSDNARFLSEDPTDITRLITNPGPEKRLNVIQITAESLSAEFLGVYGNKARLTPNLDRLFEESLVLTNFYATGTRTVRGMEALTLAIPPTPGQSIVCRSRNADLFSFGSVFRSRGYDTAFFYGGFGYFDNMNAFFSKNGYRVIDRASVPRKKVTYATVSGACDEDLFRWTLKEADSAHAAGTPFFHFVMTTSNHRPFGFPEGKIDLPSKTSGRDGGVKYTDYAIGEFLKQARERPWFTNTIVVVVADHCPSAAGKTALPINGYRIPVFIYNPALITPRKVGTLCSQIDLPPTLLGLLSWTYPSRFYGKDVLRMRPEEARAFLSTSQKMGYLTDDRLAVLEPVRRRLLFKYHLPHGDTEKLLMDDTIYDATAFFQTASYLYSRGMNRALEASPTNNPPSEVTAGRK